MTSRPVASISRFALCRSGPRSPTLAICSPCTATDVCCTPSDVTTVPFSMIKSYISLLCPRLFERQRHLVERWRVGMPGDALAPIGDVDDVGAPIAKDVGEVGPAVRCPELLEREGAKQGVFVDSRRS